MRRNGPLPTRTLAGLFLLGLVASMSAMATVTVNVNGNVATAVVELPDANTPTSTATVTIAFDSVTNLTPDSLNLTASLIDPGHPPPLPAQVSIDPAFPVLIEIEPTVALFRNGFESGQTGNGNLAFTNTYVFDIDTSNLQCASATSTYRLFKAEHGSDTFDDVTEDLFHGSVRARGRGGAFSRFVLVKDDRPQTLVGLPIIAPLKLTNLVLRLAAAPSVTGTLLTTLVGLLTQVTTDLTTLNINAALSDLDLFIAGINAASSSNAIANKWNADRSLTNDAGELLGLAQSLRFSLTLLKGDPVCTLPPVN
ncbi:MAG TPA: DUF6689 family protein [Rudaea sp.]|nr:DUF6689 family protein [Rudaea sp.]